VSSLIEQAARQARDNPFFLACPLAAYADSEELDDAALAAALGCQPEQLARVRLCRAPRTESPHFDTDVREIADRFELNANALAEAVRRGQVILRFRKAGPDARGTRQAARKRDPE
jgi:hypothetical protein